MNRPRRFLLYLLQTHFYGITSEYICNVFREGVLPANVFAARIRVLTVTKPNAHKGRVYGIL